VQRLQDATRSELDAQETLVGARESAADRLRSLSGSESDAQGDVELPEVRILRLQEGDVLLFQSPRCLTDKEADVLVKRIGAAFPGHRALVVEGGVELAVARIEAC